MIAKDSIFIENRRKFYKEQYRISEPMDAWHTYAQNIVHETTRDWFEKYAITRGCSILNAGSGGSTYNIKSPMIHLDLFEPSILQYPHHLVGDVEKIPANNDLFDTVICVGSVINYADPFLCLRELARILRPGGLLIIEYERSGSFEYKFENNFSYNCCRVETFYGNTATNLWVYGDDFIDGMLAGLGFSLIKEKRFHALSSVVLAITKSPEIAAKFTLGDQYISQIWPLCNIASNRMLVVEKLTK